MEEKQVDNETIVNALSKAITDAISEGFKHLKGESQIANVDPNPPREVTVTEDGGSDTKELNSKYEVK